MAVEAVMVLRIASPLVATDAPQQSKLTPCRYYYDVAGEEFGIVSIRFPHG
jgi:hypothetical protein